MKLKAWCVYSGEPEWCHFTLVLENGWAPFRHLCSHPGFGPGDLWLRRTERHKVMERMGIEIDLQPGTMKQDEFIERFPDTLKKHQAKEWQPLSDEYERIKKEIEAAEKVEAKP